MLEEVALKDELFRAPRTDDFFFLVLVPDMVAQTAFADEKVLALGARERPSGYMHAVDVNAEVA